MTSFSPAIPDEANLYQAYVQGLKLYWKNELYARVAAQARGMAADGAEALERRMRDGSPDYRLYGWLERHLQQFKYVGRHGVLPVMAAQEPALVGALDAAARRHPQRLRLDPSLRLPDYFTASDFHQHPGGIWSDDIDAFGYEWAAGAFSFSMLAADAPYRWLARHVVDRFGPRRAIDLGCGFGKLAIPLKQLDPRIEVTGVDLSAPLLRLAHLRALEAGLDITWLQADAESVPLPDAHADAVVSYWLLHELPPAAIDGVLAESLRLLQPGGVFAALDMYTSPGGTVGEWLHLGHAARNNEPFLPGLLAVDVRARLRDAGFVDVQLVQSTSGEPVADDAPLADTRTHTFTVVTGRRPA